MAVAAHMLDGIWFDQPRVEEEVHNYWVYKANQGVKKAGAEKKVVKEASRGVADQIAQAREAIHKTLRESDSSIGSDAIAKMKKMESENVELRRLVDVLVKKMESVETRLSKLESGGSSATSAPVSAPKKASEEDDDDDDDDIDLFGSDDEADAEAEKIKQERLDAYHAKKAKKPTIVAKSNIILDVKPWDDETDMGELERSVRSVATDGLVWGASKLVDVAFGVKKLQISCVVEDDKVGTDYLEEEITQFDNFVQSVDVVAFNKV